MNFNSWVFKWRYIRHVSHLLNTPSKTNECPLIRDYFSRKYIFQPWIFRGHSLVFRGVPGNFGVDFPTVSSDGKLKETTKQTWLVVEPPIWKIFVKLEIFPKVRGENKKCLKPPPRWELRKTCHQWLHKPSSSVRYLYIWNQGSSRSLPDILACLGAWFQIYWELEDQGNVYFIWHTPPKFNSSPLKFYHPNGKMVFQPPFFRVYVKLCTVDVI